MSRPLQLGSERPLGPATCTFGLARPECEKPAAAHIWVKAPDGSDCIVCACAEHFPLLMERDGIVDFHDFGGVCNIPGTMWQFSATGEQGFCFLPLSDDGHVSAHQDAAPELVTM